MEGMKMKGRIYKYEIDNRSKTYDWQDENWNVSYAPNIPLEIFSIQCMNTEYRYQPLQTIYVLLLFKGW